LTLDKVEKKRLKKIVTAKLDASMKKVVGGVYYVTYENKKAMYGAKYKLASLKRHGAVDCGKAISIRRFTIYTYCGFELRFNYRGDTWRKPIVEKHKIEVEKPHIKNITSTFIINKSKARKNVKKTDPLKALRGSPLLKKYKYYIENRKIAKGIPKELLPFILGRKHKHISKQVGVFGIRFKYDFGKKGCVYIIGGAVDSWEKRCH
jgi:hypothetical protein